MPYRFYKDVSFGPDGRMSSSLNGCRIHTNVCDWIKWEDGSEECMMCARDRQDKLKPFTEWTK